MEPDVYYSVAVAMDVFVKSIQARRQTLDKAFVQQVFKLIEEFFDEVKP
ncbi:MAG TPA: hypothetical protein VGJ94_13070 [Syntrophorhabdaceae bacterium]